MSRADREAGALTGVADGAQGGVLRSSVSGGLDVERDGLRVGREEAVDVAGRLAIIRWTSSGRSVSRRKAATTSGPNVMLGTKWPSMTSRCSRSTPALSSLRTTRSRWPKSAVRMLAATDPVPHQRAPELMRPRCHPAARPAVQRRAGPVAAGRAGRRADRSTSSRRRAPRRCRLPGQLGGQLAARGADVHAAIAADGRVQAGRAQDGREGLDPIGRRGLPGRVGDRVHGDEVDVGEPAAEQARRGVGVAEVSLMPAIITIS